MVRRVTAMLVFVLAFSVGSMWLFAQEPEEPSVEVESEGGALRFPPMAVDQRIFASDNLWLSEVARKIEAGTASIIERRYYHSLVDRMYPFEKPVPSRWRQDAMRVKESIKKKAEAGESSSWSLIGPPSYTENGTYNSGRGTALWVDPADRNFILLGTADGGVWKSTDQGRSWVSIFESAATQSVGCLVADPTNRNTIFVGTGEANNGGDNLSGVGVYKTTNGGSSWTLVDLPWGYQQPYHHLSQVAIDPRNSQRVYVSGDGGVYISTNGGASFTRTTLGVTSGAIIASDLALDSSSPSAGQPSIVYAALGYVGGADSNGIYRSVDGGNTWTQIGSTKGWGGRVTFIMAPSNKKVLYALIHDTTVQQGASSICYTQDATAASPQWNCNGSSPNFCEGQCWYDITGCVDPSNPSKVFVGGIDSYVSTNNGASLSKVSCWNCYDQVASYSHADHHAMYMPDSNTIYDANDGGFFVGSVSGTNVSWEHRNTGLPTLQFFSISQHPTDPTKMGGGLQDNGHAYYDGTKWDMVQGGDGAWAEWDQQNPNFAYEAYVYGYIRRNSNMVADPKNWQCIGNYPGCPDCNTQLCTPDGRAAFVTPFQLDPNDQNVMYTGSYRLLKNSSVRTGSSWTPVSGDLTANQSAFITAIHPARNDGQSGTIYVGTLDGKVQMTSNGGGSWADRSSGIDQAKICGFTTHPKDGNKVLVVTSGYGAKHVYRSTNGGANWTDISGQLPAIPFNCVALDPKDPNHAYAGADMGVFENTSVWTSSTWSDISSNLPMAAVHAFTFNPSTGSLRAATHGRNVWELSGGSAQCMCKGDVTCDGAVNVGDSIQVKRCILNLDGTSTCSRSDVTGDGATNVGDSIQLKRYILGLDVCP